MSDLPDEYVTVESTRPDGARVVTAVRIERPPAPGSADPAPVEFELPE